MKTLALIFCGFCLAFAFPASAPAQTITSQPQGITINNASTAAFTVVAGDATNYQWQFDGTNLSDVGNITGSTNSVLTLEDVGTNQAGIYTVVINGSVTSSNAVLTIVPGTIVTFTFSGIIGGGPSNVDVQLFDHDKPATVENFLHYIRAGGYTNMFFDRCYPSFVLQGGDDGASNQTSTNPPLTGWSINSEFTTATNQVPPYPQQLNNESGIGPAIHNRFGTIAMALSSNPNSANSAFFFNLVDNLFLDSDNGESFTVFGRILDGTNVLQYFNQLTVGQGGVANGEILLNGQSQPQPVPDTGDGSFLPVNYIGTNAPANSNLIFCNFSFTNGAPPVDTTPPAVSITSPPAGAVLSNGNPTIQGTASDDVAVAVVICELIPQSAADGTFPNGGVSITNYAIGTTNWSAIFTNVYVPPGTYSLSIQSQDGAGNLSPTATQPLMITAIVTNGNGTVTFSQGVFSNLNAVGYPFQVGSNYNLVATAGSNQLFVGWNNETDFVLTPELAFPMSEGVVWTATFISNGIPNDIAFTYPAPNAVITNAAFNITGTISNDPSPPVTVTVQVYSTTTDLAIGPPLTNVGTTNWSVTMSNLSDDTYAVEAIAVDAASNSTTITENFDVSLPAGIVSGPQSITVNNASTATFTVGTSNAVSYQWQFQGSNIAGATSATLTLENVNTNQAGGYTVVVSSAINSVTSSPPAVLTILPGTIVTFMFSPFADGTTNQVDVQLFNHDKPVTVQNFLHYITSGAYTNMFFDRCNPNFVLQGGDYGASNQTSTSPPLTGWFIDQQFTLNDSIEPELPAQITNEFNFGTLIHNRFGTIAMALGDYPDSTTSDPNSAKSAFFFNLVDNSGAPNQLDSEDFTVFGRILDGTNVLQYFNTLTNGGGSVTNGEIVFDDGLETNQVSSQLGSVLPVNYMGTNAPANSNLIFCTFVLTQPLGATNLPTVSIISPTTNALLSNGFSLTIQGTATDNNNIGLASVRCDLIPLAAPDGTLPNGGVALTNYVLGLTNWTVNFGAVPPGEYELGAQAQDEAGNLSPEVFLQPLIITAVITNGNGSVTFSLGVFSNLNAVGYPFQVGSNYDLVATAGTNQVFVSWNTGADFVLTPELPFAMSGDSLWTATFISNGIPNSIAFTYPTPNEIISNATFNITGTISNDPSTPVTVTCRIYSTTTGLAVGPPLTSVGTTNWSVTVNNFVSGSYVVEAIAVDVASNSTAITQNFSASLPAEIFIEPQSITVNNASTATFTVGASNAMSYQWQFQGSNIAGATGPTLTLQDVSSNQAGDYSVIVSSTINSVTSSNAVLTIVNGTVVQFILYGLTNGNVSNVVNVQLFDHDKPATVQNFLHYIRSGAFTNMFFDRCIPYFVLQGGDYGATDRTNTSPPITGWDIASMFTDASNQPNPPYPHQVDSEFNVGPLIPNSFGTIAMALAAGEQNSAASAFFFNLDDNSANLDFQDGGFTVFGRILDAAGTNVLQYFNTVSDDSGIATNGVLVDEALQTTNLTVTTLPVNYSGTNAPANANLVFCDFQLPTNAPVDTNPPTVAITSPAPNAVLTNGNPIIQGTASDDVGLAVVICVLIPQAAADGALPNGGLSITNYANGTTNWLATITNPDDAGQKLVPPGNYSLVVQSQDGAGNLSAAATQPLIITAIVTNGGGIVTFTNGVFTNLDAVGYPFQIGTTYDLEATAATNQIFANWTTMGYNAIYPGVSFTMDDGLLLTATFISNGIPNSIAFTYPRSNEVISANIFNITGTISNDLDTPVTVTCQIYSTTTYEAIGGPLTTSGATGWSEPATNLAVGSYIVEAIALDQDGRSTLITEDFSVSTYATLQLTIVGPGTVSGATNGEPILIGETFSVTAIPNPGQSFYAWNDGIEVSLNPAQTYTMAEGLSLTALFVTNNISNMIAFTYPEANAIIGTNSFYITGTISNSSSNSALVTCQIFSATTLLSVTQPLETSGATNWSIGTAGLSAGSYIIVATAEDPAGDGALISEGFSVQNAANLQLIIVGKGTVSGATNGESLPIGTNFQVTATPASGQVFYTWNNGTQISTNATQTNTMAYGLTLTATFIPSNTAKGISFTYPAAHAILSTNTFSLKGRIASSMKSAQVTCQFFQTNGVAVGAPLTTSGTNTWAIGVTNLPGGNYLVEAQATNAAGKSTIISENFSILPFAAVQGTYSGLFICTTGPVTPTNSGFLTFTLTATGAMTGKLDFPAYAPVPIYPLPFQNIEFVLGFAQFSSANFYGNSLLGAIYVDLDDGTDEAYGTLSSEAWSSQLICYRDVKELSTNTTPAAGKYILSLQPGNQTNGSNTNGYASIAVARNGAMALSGALPDDATFSQSTRVSTNGVWPLYAIPIGYKTNGMLMGWETNQPSGGSSGRLYWYKAANIGAYDNSGVNTNINSPGTNFLRPASGSLYSIVLGGGTIVPPLTNILKVNNAGQFVVAGGPADKLRMSLSANGVITGYVLNTNDNKTLRFSGAFMSPSQGGSGFIPDAGGQTGCFVLKPAAP
jgi:cyclophilin family peptidyl-prolyl cis-trans isomerase